MGGCGVAGPQDDTIEVESIGVWTRRVGRAADCARVLTARADTPRGFESPTLLWFLAPVAQEGTERRKTSQTGHRQRVAEAPNGVELLLGKRVIPVCLTLERECAGSNPAGGTGIGTREVGRAAECARLENGSSSRGRGFESLTSLFDPLESTSKPLLTSS